MMNKTLYKAKYILPMNGSIIENGEMLVCGDLISAIGVHIDISDNCKIVDLKNCVLMPGFINTHSHIEYTMCANKTDAKNLWAWIDEVGFRPGKTPDTSVLLNSALKGADECVKSGITCLADSSFSGIAYEAIKKTGIRGIVYHEMFGQSAEDKLKSKFDEKLEYIQSLNAEPGSIIKHGISPHSIYTANTQLLSMCAEVSLNKDIPIAIHVSETEDENQYSLHGTGFISEWRKKLGYEPTANGKTPVKYLNDIGMLNRNVCLAHCTNINETEIDIIAKSKAGVAHCARSNANLGSGIAPFAKMLRKNVNAGLGTDSSASSGSYNFFEEMRFALGLQRAFLKDAGEINAQNIIEQTTIGGAKALNMENKIGSLELDKKADFIAVNIENMVELNSIYMSVLNANPNDVILNVVNGVSIWSSICG